ncbi:MAG: hypothetical protein AB1611_13810 [bacterium]
MKPDASKGESKDEKPLDRFLAGTGKEPKIGCKDKDQSTGGYQNRGYQSSGYHDGGYYNGGYYR